MAEDKARAAGVVDPSATPPGQQSKAGQQQANSPINRGRSSVGPAVEQPVTRAMPQDLVAIPASLHACRV